MGTYLRRLATSMMGQIGITDEMWTEGIEVRNPPIVAVHRQSHVVEIYREEVVKQLKRMRLETLAKIIALGPSAHAMSVGLSRRKSGLQRFTHSDLFGVMNGKAILIHLAAAAIMAEMCNILIERTKIDLYGRPVGIQPTYAESLASIL